MSDTDAATVTDSPRSRVPRGGGGIGDGPGPLVNGPWESQSIRVPKGLQTVFPDESDRLRIGDS